jgi:biopolymer transport protein ExbD
MKTTIQLILLTALCVHSAMAGGSISWEEVKSRIAKTDPGLVKTIEDSFTVNRSGGGVRLGPRFGERHGERIPPYEFGAEEKKTKARCVLIIEESEDHEFTGRFKFVKRPVEAEDQESPEAPAAGQPAIEVPARNAEPAENGDAGPELIIGMPKDGSIRFEGKALQGEELVARLEPIVKKFPNQAFLIRAHKTVKYEDVVSVLDLCRRAGVRNVAFATEKAGGGE